MTNRINSNWESLLNPNEKNAYREIFIKIDTDDKGVVLQEEAMNFLKKSDIPYNILMQLWQRSDDDNKGFLTFPEFCILLKLIACSQQGVVPNDLILSTPVLLPTFNGRGTPVMSKMTSPRTGESISKENRLKYINIFQSLGPMDNVLTADKCKTFFLRSRLPTNILQAIWQLADTRHTGQLNQTEFVIAMHYIENTMKGIGPLPPTLPPTVYTSATGRVIPSSPLVRQNTFPIRSPVFQGVTQAPLDILPDEFNKYKTFFNQLDTDHSGYIEGQDAVVFFKHSKLPDSELARMWDLADTQSTGKLTLPQFAMVMHMINRRLAGEEIPDALPGIDSHRPSDIPHYTAPTVDLLGLESEQSTVESNLKNERNRVNQLKTQLSQEQQSYQALLEQVQQQKQLLEKTKQEAEETEKLLEAEKKKKEELMKELQMYRQETGHYNHRIEQAKEDMKEVQQEISTLHKPADVFSLSSTPDHSGGLFAKVPENELQVPAQTTERRTGSPLDISDIESKFPDLTTMENDFTFSRQEHSPSTADNQFKSHEEHHVQPNQEDLFKPSQDDLFRPHNEQTSPKLNVFQSKENDLIENIFKNRKEEDKTKDSAGLEKKKEPKYKFDLSMFDSFSNDTSSIVSEKDELTRLFSPQPQSAQAAPAEPVAKKSDFDDIFG